MAAPSVVAADRTANGAPLRLNSTTAKAGARFDQRAGDLFIWQETRDHAETSIGSKAVWLIIFTIALAGALLVPSGAQGGVRLACRLFRASAVVLALLAAVHIAGADVLTPLVGGAGYVALHYGSLWAFDYVLLVTSVMGLVVASFAVSPARSLRFNRLGQRFRGARRRDAQATEMAKAYAAPRSLS
ncbi:MAG: hypothetical protein AAGG72_08465 [Pseudomonadota bacterium]